MDNKIHVIMYTSCTNRTPFIAWFNQLDTTTQLIVDKHITKLRVGVFGDIRRIIGGKGVCELRIHSGSGYRIYFGYQRLNIIIILLGGNKKTQGKDLEKAKKYWKKYKEMHHG